MDREIGTKECVQRSVGVSEEKERMGNRAGEVGVEK